MGFATLPAGTLNYMTASAIAKVLKEKGGMNVLVQPTAGDAVILPMVNRNEAEIGITNILEVVDAVSGAAKIGKQPNLRLIGVPHTFRGTFWVQQGFADEDHRRSQGPPDAARLFRHADHRPAGAGDPRHRRPDREGRLSGAGAQRGAPAPMPSPTARPTIFFFAFGAPKVREVDATVGGIRALVIPASGLPAAQKIFAYGYLTKAVPNPFFVGVNQPMDVYAWDNLLITNDKVPDDVIYKIIDTLVKNKADLVAVQPALREFSAAEFIQSLRPALSSGRAEILQGP